jgi:hypothetical protein
MRPTAVGPYFGEAAWECLSKPERESMIERCRWQKSHPVYGESIILAFERHFSSSLPLPRAGVSNKALNWHPEPDVLRSAHALERRFPG